METQQTISEWGRATFGRSSALSVATRMNIEVAELLLALAELDRDQDTTFKELLRANAQIAEAVNAYRNQHHLNDHPELDRTDARVECADVAIMLDQVMDALGGDLVTEKTAKMAVVRRRVWAQTENGKHQHVEGAQIGEDGPLLAVASAQPASFREPGTGIDMRDDLWYIISDSGSSYVRTGFESPERAKDWADSPAVIDSMGGRLTLTVPKWDDTEHCWPEGLEMTNVVKGEHCRKFWMKNDREMFEEIQRVAAGVYNAD